jgi:hypothetical protein
MADQTTDTPQMTGDEINKTIFLARHAASDKTFTLFQKGLADEKIPWSFSDERFLKKVQDLKNTLITELNLQNEKQASQAAEESFSRSLSEEDREGMTRGFEQIRQQEKTLRKELLAHKETLVNDYVEQLKKQNALPPEQELTVRASVSQAIQQAVSRGDLSEATKQMALAVGDQVPVETASAAALSLELSPEALETANKITQLSNTTKTALTIGDDVQTEAFIKKCLSNPDTEPELIASQNSGESQAIKAFSLSEDVQEKINTVLNDPVKRNNAIRLASESAVEGTVKFTKEMGDAIVGPGGKKLFDDVVSSVLGKSIEGISATGFIGDQKLTVNSQTDEKIQKMKQSLSLRASNQGAPTIAPSERLVTLWAPQIQEGFRIYLESASVRASANAPAYFHYFILAGSDVWRAIVGNSTKRVAGEAVKKAGGKIISGAAIKTVITGFGAVFGGIPAAIVTWIGRELIGKGISFVWGGIKGLFSFLQLGDITEGFRGGFEGAPKPLHKQNDVLLAIICLGSLLFCTGFALTKKTATNSAIVEEKDKTSSEVSSEPSIINETTNVNRPGGTSTTGDHVVFQYNGPLPPFENTTLCPTQGGYISQQPFTSTGSHRGVNAYDIAVTQGTPVVATHDSYVVNYRSSFSPNQFARGSYGNFVLLVYTDANGRKITAMSAHLLDVTPEVAAARGTTTLIKAGTIIGRVDTTGYTYTWRGEGGGTHLHYEEQGGGRLTLPPGCPQ